MDAIQLKKILVDYGCDIQVSGFIALKSGRVAQRYINIDPALTHPTLVKCIAEGLGDIFENEPDICTDIEVVGGPAIGAIPLVYAVANEIMNCTRRPTRTVFAEKVGDGFRLDRLGFAEAVLARNVLLVEDIVTTGGSLQGAADAVQAAGGKVVGAVALWNRGNPSFSFPFRAVINEQIPSATPDEMEHWGELPLVSNLGHPDAHFPQYGLRARYQDCLAA